MTKTELLALADALLGDRYRMSGVALRSASAALREFAGMMDAGPEPIISMKRNEFDSLSLGAKSVLGTLIGGMKAPYRDELKSISRDDPRHPLYTHPPAPTTQKVCHGIPRIGCNYLAECDSICNKCGQLHAVQFIPPAPTTQEPVAWLAAYVNSEGLPDQYVTTHHELAVENDANGAPKPLFFHPPTTHEPMAWIDSMGHPHHLSAIQGVREKQLYGPWRPLYD